MSPQTPTPVGPDNNNRSILETITNAPRNREDGNADILSRATGEHQRIATATGSPLVGLLTISTLLLPMAFVPFLALRRRLVHMEKKLDRLVKMYEISIRDEEQRVRTVVESHQKWLQNLDRQLGAVAVEIRSGRKDQVRELLGVARRLNENDKNYKQSVEDVQNVRATLEENSSRVRDIQSQIEAIARSTTRYDHVLGRLGGSLADVAAFIHETEVRHGIVHDRDAGGSRRVEVLRTLGYDLHSFSNEAIKCPSNHRVKPVSSTE